MISQGEKMEEQGSKTQLERGLAALAHGSILLGVGSTLWRLKPLGSAGDGIGLRGSIIGGIIGIGVALAIWLAMKGKSDYARGQALQAIVYQVAVVVLWLGGSGVWVILHVFTSTDFIGGGSPEWAYTTMYAFPVGFPVLAILYALWGAVRCLGGHDFRYAIVGKLLGRWI
jgi:hypothetical protein